MSRLVARRADHGRILRVLAKAPAAAGVGLLLAIVAWTGAGYASRLDGFCSEACHAMRPYQAAAAQGPHAGVECRECHSSPGLAGAIAEGVAVQRRAVAQLAGRTPAESGFSDASCRSCHPAIQTATLVKRGIAVRHQDFMENECTHCHGGAGHLLDGRIYDVTEMDDCMTCHSASGREPEGCELCHAQERDRERLKRSSSWRITHGPDWATTHGMGDMGSCVSCHVPTYCARCHGVALPHPSGWAREHGKDLARRDRATCEVCHQRSWCTGCHGVEMPHAAGFIEVHGPAADEAGDTTCYRCHPKTACDDCHFRSSHPDLPGVGNFHTGGSE